MNSIEGEVRVVRLASCSKDDFNKFKGDIFQLIPSCYLSKKVCQEVHKSGIYRVKITTEILPERANAM